MFWIVLLIATLASCKKSNDDEPQENLTAIDADVAEVLFEELTDISELAFRSINNQMKSNEVHHSINCATVTIDTLSLPHVMIIDFGEENCLGNDGKWRRGKIIVTFTGRFHQPGTVITTTFDEYYVNDNQVEGTRIMTNLGPNDEGFPQYEFDIDGIITLANNQGVITWQAGRLRTWIEGYNTPAWYDNVFLITGSGTLTHSNGGGFTRTIIEPLRRELSCHHFVSGIVQTIPTERPARTLDYGEGVCDNLATLTIGNRSRIIRLR